MKHTEFLEKIEKALYPTHMDARPALSKLIETRGFEISLRYDWIKNTGVYKWATESKEIDFVDGVERITFFVCEEYRES